MRDDAVDARATIQPDRANPWDRDAAPPRLGDLGIPQVAPAGSNGEADDPEGDRSGQYAAWAQRMKSKRERTRAMVGNATADSTATADQGAHWSTDALYAESRLVEEQESVSRPNPWRTRELLSTLDLEGDASLDEIGAAYRRLAKTHHPDRYLDADAGTQEFHAQRMLDINAAYTALKALHATSG